MRTRLSGRGSVDYQVTRTNEEWPDHVLRTLVTGSHIAWLKPMSVLDPACGDGSIVKAAAQLYPFSKALLNDISRPNIRALSLNPHWEADTADVYDALCNQPDDSWDVVVLTEILEHLDDPDAVLRQAKRVGLQLVASSPEMRPEQVDNNGEHLWMFDGDGYRQMLVDSGWNPYQKSFLGFPLLKYDFQIWVANRG